MKSLSILHLGLPLLELLHLVHGDVFVDQLVHLFVHLQRQLPPGDPPEADDQEKHKDYDRYHSECYPSRQVGALRRGIFEAARRHRRHALANRLKDLIRLKVSPVDDAVDDYARIV